MSTYATATHAAEYAALQPQMFSTPTIVTATATNTIPAATNNTVVSTTSTQQNMATAAATVYSSHELAMENIMPGIFLTKNFMAWNEENLRTHGFTHIIIIDKHIQELYYPTSPLFKLTPHNNNNSSSCSKYDAYDDNGGSPFDHFSPTTATLSFGKEFTALDLNFGEKSYLTTVLPNCYRAVQFINKALQSNGSILVIDCNGGEQKCVTVVVAYLMYKHNINFSAAFARLKQFYKKADLDRFYTSQLYEYEPILQVQRAQSRGHSCSRARQAAILKRKQLEDDEITTNSITTTTTKVTNDIIDFANDFAFTGCHNATDFFNSFNPLTQFNASSTTTATHAADCIANATTTTTVTNNNHHLNNNTMTTTQSCLQPEQQKQNNIRHDGAAAVAINTTQQAQIQQQHPIQLSTYYKSVYNNNNNTCDDDYAME